MGETDGCGAGAEGADLGSPHASVSQSTLAVAQVEGRQHDPAVAELARTLERRASKHGAITLGQTAQQLSDQGFSRVTVRFLRAVAMVRIDEAVMRCQLTSEL